MNKYVILGTGLTNCKSCGRLSSYVILEENEEEEKVPLFCVYCKAKLEWVK